MNLIDQIENELVKSRGIPFLFVGSGLSRRYLELEDWASLLKRYATKHDFDYYSSKVDGNLPAAASDIAEDFFERWWSDEFAAHRAQFDSPVTTKLECLKYAIALHMKAHEANFLDAALAQDEVKALRSATIDGIITTNWDCFLERAFPEFEVFVGQRELLVSCPQEIAEIYKIHGCRTQPSSMVLTKQDYDRFDSDCAYLAAKLVALFVERPIIFLGYSLTDPNIQLLLRNVIRGLGASHVNRLQDKLLFVQRDGESEGDAFYKSNISIGDVLLPVNVVRTNDFSQVYQSTRNLKREYPIRALRALKSQVYDLVLSSNPGEKMAVIDLEKVDHETPVEVVVGVGVFRILGEHGYTPVTRQRLLRDVLSDDGTLDPIQVLQNVLPRLFRGNAKYVPVFKYLAKANFDSAASAETCTKLFGSATKTVNDFVAAKHYAKHRDEVVDLSFEELHSRYGPDVVYYIPLLDWGARDIEELRRFCDSHFDDYNGSSTHHHALQQTAFCAACCLYDFLRWGQS